MTALLTEAALRDPRLSDPASLVRAARWVDQHADEFARTFPEQEPVPRTSGARDAA